MVDWERQAEPYNITLVLWFLNKSYIISCVAQDMMWTNYNVSLWKQHTTELYFTLDELQNIVICSTRDGGTNLFDSFHINYITSCTIWVLFHHLHPKIERSMFNLSQHRLLEIKWEGRGGQEKQHSYLVSAGIWVRQRGRLHSSTVSCYNYSLREKPPNVECSICYSESFTSSIPVPKTAVIPVQCSPHWSYCR